jgi:hypothetical protein
MKSGQIWLALYKEGVGVRWHKHRIVNNRFEYEHSSTQWRGARLDEVDDYFWKPANE